MPPDLFRLVQALRAIQVSRGQLPWRYLDLTMAQLKAVMLLCRTGRARSRMLPCGSAEIGGRTYDVVSEGMAIEPGTPVEVIAVRGNRVVVRPVEQTASAGAGSRSTGSHAEGSSAGRPGEADLARPIDSIGLNPFEDPLA